MGRKAVPQPLTLPDNPTLPENQHPTSGETVKLVPPPSSGSRSSPRSPRSPFSRFSPKKSQPSSNLPSPSPYNQIEDPSQAKSRSLEDYDDEEDDANQQYPLITSALHQPSDTPTRPHHQQRPSQVDIRQPVSQPDTPGAGSLYQQQHQQQHHEPTRPSKSSSFFSFAKSNAKSGHQHSYSKSRVMSRSPDLSISQSGNSNNKVNNKLGKNQDRSYAEQSGANHSDPLPSRSQVSLVSTVGEYEANSGANTSTRKSKPKPFGLLHRTKSGRDRDSPNLPEQSTFPTTNGLAEPDRENPLASNAGLRTAPLPSERTFRDMMSSAVRNRSEDRAPSRGKESGHRPAPSSSLSRENTGFLYGLRNSSTKAADMISKGLFGKGMRSASTNEREPVIDDEHYVLKVINLPLIEQTRLTRISKRLEDSRDKTEFWMPAFPWRAIDYLNYKGCDVEGLYRVPGSGPQVKKWQRRFDEEYDVNLFEQNDLYDINIIGSMLKAWLRELPDELFPKDAQNRVTSQCAGSDKVPELLIEELSNLPPFNYYLLFAITCHLSLLLAHSDKNKMDFRNLCICFQPCMKIDAFCFKFLVCDWRDCWRGCNQEAKYIELEYQMFDLPLPQNLYGTRTPTQESQEFEDQQYYESQSDFSALHSHQSHESQQEYRDYQNGHDTQLLGRSPEISEYREPEKPQKPSLIISTESTTTSPMESNKTPGHQPQQPEQPEESQMQTPKTPKAARLKKKPLQLQGPTNGSMSGSAAESNNGTNLTINSDRFETPKRVAELRPLSPIKPLSPLGF